MKNARQKNNRMRKFSRKMDDNNKRCDNVSQRISVLQAQQVPAHFVAAMRQAQARAQALAAEFGG